MLLHTPPRDFSLSYALGFARARFTSYMKVCSVAVGELDALDGADRVPARSRAGTAIKSRAVSPGEELPSFSPVHVQNGRCDCRFRRFCESFKYDEAVPVRIAVSDSRKKTLLVVLELFGDLAVLLVDDDLAVLAVLREFLGCGDGFILLVQHTRRLA